ncbi:MAG: hypothetical protein U9Q21_00830 [Candidatus Auribacterota bacterium]|nr:hypothetical protein [Candidatus Auribacterota bacterium]
MGRRISKVIGVFKGILFIMLGLAVGLSSFIKMGSFQFPLNRFIVFVFGIFMIYLGIGSIIDIFRRK